MRSVTLLLVHTVFLSGGICLANERIEFPDYRDGIWDGRTQVHEVMDDVL